MTYKYALLTLAHIITLSCIGSCTVTRTKIEKPEPVAEIQVDEYLAPPVSTWTAITAEQRFQLDELVANTQSAGDTNGAMGWMKALVETLPEDEPWQLWFGLSPIESVVEADFAPFILLPNEDTTLVLARVCTATSGCVSCRDATTRARASEGEAEITPPVPPRKTFSGICSTLATAYSLVYVLEKRTQLGDLAAQEHTTERVNDQLVTKKKWKKGFLDQIKTAQGHNPGEGTPRTNLKKAYEIYGCTCDDEVKVSNSLTAQNWTAQLKSELEKKPPVDCHFIIQGADWAHDMHIEDVGDDGKIQVANTGIQGSGNGDDVPVIVGGQEWSVSGTSSAPAIQCHSSNTGVGSKNFWNGLNATSAAYRCCSCPPVKDAE